MWLIWTLKSIRRFLVVFFFPKKNKFTLTGETSGETSGLGGVDAYWSDESFDTSWLLLVKWVTWDESTLLVRGVIWDEATLIGLKSHLGRVDFYGWEKSFGMSWLIGEKSHLGWVDSYGWEKSFGTSRLMGEKSHLGYKWPTIFRQTQRCCDNISPSVFTETTNALDNSFKQETSMLQQFSPWGMC